MYVPHYAPDNASMIVRLVLESAGLPYRPALVDRRRRQQKSPAYLALNPTGLIPTLETPSGPIGETGAILLWLGDTHGLCPGPAYPDRGDLLRWLFFLSNTVHADLRQVFHPEGWCLAFALEAQRPILTARMIGHFHLLDTAADAKPQLFTPEGLLAPYLCALMRWSVLYPLNRDRWFDLRTFPRLAAIAGRLEATAASVRVARAEGLGANPFTRPVLPCPPEGAAL